jgi:hypothetical protein
MNREHEDDERSTAELHRSLPLNAMSAATKLRTNNATTFTTPPAGAP